VTTPTVDGGVGGGGATSGGTIGATTAPAGAGTIGATAAPDVSTTSGGTIGATSAPDASSPIGASASSAAPSVGAGGTPNVAGSATIGAGAGVGGGSSVTSSTSFDSSAPDISGMPDDATGQIRDTEFQAGTVSGEAAVYREVGPDGKAVVKGGAAGVSERNVPGQADIDAGGGAVKAARLDAEMGASADLRGNVEGATSTTGFRDPVSEAGRAEQLGTSQHGRVVAGADVASDDVADARRMAANPNAAASAEVGTRTGVDPSATRSQADAVAGTVRDPQGVAEAKAEVRSEELGFRIDPPCVDRKHRCFLRFTSIRRPRSTVEKEGHSRWTRKP